MHLFDVKTTNKRKEGRKEDNNREKRELDFHYSLGTSIQFSKEGKQLLILYFFKDLYNNRK